MRKNRLVAGILSLLMIITAIPLAGANWTWGTLINSIETIIAPEAVYNHYDAEDSAGVQKINAVTFNPKNEYTQLRAGKTYNNIYGVQTVSGIADLMDKSYPGQVVAAINGDYFDLGIGVPFGVFIDEGEILKSPLNYYSAFGIKNDGTPFVISHGAILDKTLYIGSEHFSMTGINMLHEYDNSLVLYTQLYGSSTRAKKESYEAVCTIDSGELRHGGTLKLTVSDLRDGVGNAPIGAGKAVLSAVGTEIATLKKLKIGQSIEITFKFNQFWSDVKFAIGGDKVILKDGKVVNWTDPTRGPRTLIGYKANGNVVFATVDGRQKSYSVGLTFKQAAQMMLDLGCTDAVNLDGGGSTTFVMRDLGETARKLLNRPSDGHERKIANAVVLLNTAPAGDASQLVVGPNGRKVLQGGVYTYKIIGAADENYQPKPAEGPFYWSVDPSYGSITEDGVLAPTASGFVSVGASNDYISGSTLTEVVSDITAIRSSITNLHAQPGQVIDIPVTAWRGKQEIESTSGAYEWSVTNNAGSFIAPGKFKAADTITKGDIIVKFGGVSLTIPVSNSVDPVILSDFDTNSVNFVGVGVGSKMAPCWKYETDTDHVIFGSGSLKMYYNFLNTTKDVGSYLMIDPKSAAALSITQQPNKLGMWVYGDGSGVLLRSILEGADGKQATVTYTDKSGINWYGWKYVETPAPTLVLPIKVKAPFYLASNGQKRTHGCLYFDRLRAVYTPVTGEDYVLPALVKAWPNSGDIISTRRPEIGIILSDNTKTETDAGINPASIQLIVNGYTCKDARYDAKTGKITYQIKYALKNGYHSIKVRAKDRFGNPYIREWRFEVRA